MRRLLPLLTLSLVLLACGTAAQRTASARASARSCTRVELNRVRLPVSSGRATLHWEVASTAGVSHFQIERKLGDGRWVKYPPIPTSARSYEIHSLPGGSAEFRIWAVLGHPQRRPRNGGSAKAIAVGLNAGYWGSCEPAELSTAVRYIRLDTPRSIAPWSALGLKVIADESGPYDHSGVSGLDVSAYVEKVLALVRASPQVLAIEVLNEPGGQWFWGGEAESEANREAYAKLIIAVHEALVASFGARRPLILASYDGGHDSSNAWGEAWTKNRTALADADMLTVHPYGGTDERAVASLGNRAHVEAAHAQSGKPIAITEVGWPTAGPTSDSLAYSEAEQAQNISAFVAWAKSTGYVKLLTIYNYRDTYEGGGYGVQTHRGVKKPAWFALERAAREAGSG